MLDSLLEINEENSQRSLKMMQSRELKLGPVSKDHASLLKRRSTKN